MPVIHDSEFRTEVGGIKRTRPEKYEAELVAAGIPVKYVYLTSHGWGTIVLENGTGIIAHRPGEEWYPVNKVRNFICCEAARVKGVEVRDEDGNVCVGMRVCVTDTTTGGDLVLDRFLREEEIEELIINEIKETGEFHYVWNRPDPRHAVGPRHSDIHLTKGLDVHTVTTATGYGSDVKKAASKLYGWMGSKTKADADHILAQLRADHSLIPRKVL